MATFDSVIEGRQSAAMMSGSLHRGAIASTLVTPTNIFVGFNAGEWGGGLQRIDRKTGAVTTIERNESGELCGGPLNTKCDPVKGIATTPWNPDCIAIAIGLVHFFPSGRIVEVCGDVVRRLYFKAYPLPTSITHATPSPNPHPDQLRDDLCSVAFFGLTRQGDALWAIGTDGIYQIAPGGTAQMSPLPTFKRIGEFSVSFELPRFVLVITNVNQRRSVGGSVPILVPR